MKSNQPITWTWDVYSDGFLTLPTGKTVRCALGRGGVVPASQKREGDGCTPAGVWRMHEVYWRHDRLDEPETQMNLIAMRQRFGWCDAPEDPKYNQVVILPYPASAEAMWREDEIYDVCVPLWYNYDPIVPGAGSAIFLHVARPGYTPTEGCVALAREDLLTLLRSSMPLTTGLKIMDRPYLG